MEVASFLKFSAAEMLVLDWIASSSQVFSLGVKATCRWGYMQGQNFAHFNPRHIVDFSSDIFLAKSSRWKVPDMLSMLIGYRIIWFYQLG